MDTGLKVTPTLLADPKDQTQSGFQRACHTAHPKLNKPRCSIIFGPNVAGWSSLVARWAHNPKVGGSNPPPATNTL